MALVGSAMEIRTPIFCSLPTGPGYSYRDRVLVDIDTYVCVILFHDLSSLIVAMCLFTLSAKSITHALEVGQLNTCVYEGTGNDLKI